MIMFSERLGMLLKLSRVSLDVQVKEMAEKIGVSTVTILNFEKIENSDIPPILKYLLILRQEGINVNEILDKINNAQNEET